MRTSSECWAHIGVYKEHNRNRIFSNPFILSYCSQFFLTCTEKQWPTLRCVCVVVFCLSRKVNSCGWWHDMVIITSILPAKDLDTISIIIFNRSHRTNVTNGCDSLTVIWYMFDWTCDIGPGPGRDVFNLFIQLHVLRPVSYSYIFNFCSSDILDLGSGSMRKKWEEKKYEREIVKGTSRMYIWSMDIVQDKTLRANSNHMLDRQWKDGSIRSCFQCFVHDFFLL